MQLSLHKKYNPNLKSRHFNPGNMPIYPPGRFQCQIKSYTEWYIKLSLHAQSIKFHPKASPFKTFDKSKVGNTAVKSSVNPSRQLPTLHYETFKAFNHFNYCPASCTE